MKLLDLTLLVIHLNRLIDADCTKTSLSLKWQPTLVIETFLHG